MKFWYLLMQNSIWHYLELFKSCKRLQITQFFRFSKIHWPFRQSGRIVNVEVAETAERASKRFVHQRPPNVAIVSAHLGAHQSKPAERDRAGAGFSTQPVSNKFSFQRKSLTNHSNVNELYIFEILSEFSKGKICQIFIKSLNLQVWHFFTKVFNSEWFPDVKNNKID